MKILTIKVVTALMELVTYVNMIDTILSSVIFIFKAFGETFFFPTRKPISLKTNTVMSILFFLSMRAKYIEFPFSLCCIK